ncbi:hypothetical protein [Streptomyces sp. CB00455]|uniref:hypothetical protein n=1 Tax=Streptomyces sp. CB00455 TaxID=1703927 RepID=UPI00130117D7|nr:hypothetical protein [Streptomyces sp. CB00455]
METGDPPNGGGQNAEAVEHCAVCRLPRAQVAAAFTTTRYTGQTPRLGWPPKLRGIIDPQLLADGWLAEIPSVPWTLRPETPPQPMGHPVAPHRLTR